MLRTTTLLPTARAGLASPLYARLSSSLCGRQLSTLSSPPALPGATRVLPSITCAAAAARPFSADIPKKYREQKSPGAVAVRSLALMTLVAGGLYIGYERFKESQSAARVKDESVGMPDIGGPFTLVDDEGRPVCDSHYRGRYMMVYFGFTFCPDICPAELTKMAKAISILDERGWSENEIVPIFITVDPWRDSVRDVHEYVKEFHPRFVGLTGTPQQVEAAAKAYRVYTSRPVQQELSDDDDHDYLVDHSVFAYLMGPDGSFVDYFGQNSEAETIAEKTERRLNATFKPPPPPSLFTTIKGFLGLS